MTHATEPDRRRDPELVCHVCGDPIDEANDVEAHWPGTGDTPAHHWCCTDCDEAAHVAEADRLAFTKER